MGFVLALNLGLEASESASILSHQMIEMRITSSRRSRRRSNIHEISAAEYAREPYSDSVLDLATVGCVFALHDNKLFPIERRSSGLPVQSASEKHSKCKYGDF